MIKFGTGGWRAIIAEDFTFYNVKLVGKAMARYIKENDYMKKVVVGHDFRFLSGRFSRALSESLVEEGLEVMFMEEAAPTPMVMLAVEENNLHLGASITASHNSAEYNGIKIFVEGGRDAPQEVTDRLEELIAEIGDYNYQRGSFFELIKAGKIRYYNNKNQYIDSLLDIIDQELIQSKNFRILFNPMYGVAKDIMMMCLASLRCYVDTMNAYRDTMFGLDVPSPNREQLGDMEVRIEKGKYDFGLATDGDSDRMALIDEAGKFVDYNDVLKLLYYYLKEYRKESGGIVRNLATTHILDEMAAYYGEAAYEVPVGFKNISQKMQEHDLLLGGESSGGLKIRGHVNGKDGILASLLAVEMMARTGKKIGEILAEIEQKFGYLYFSYSNFDYDPSQRKRLEDLLFEAEYQPNLSNLIENNLISDKNLEKVSYLDGVKYYYDDQSWISIRFSGTEPLLRIYMEMKSKEEVQAILKFLKNDLEI